MAVSRNGAFALYSAHLLFSGKTISGKEVSLLFASGEVWFLPQNCLPL